MAIAGKPNLTKRRKNRKPNDIISSTVWVTVRDAERVNVFKTLMGYGALKEAYGTLIQIGLEKWQADNNRSLDRYFDIKPEEILR